MTITLKLAASGEHGDSKVPKLKHEVDWAFDEERKCYDRAKLMQSLGNDQVLIGSDDSTNCIVVGATILQEFHANMEKIQGVRCKDFSHEDPSKLRGSERKLHKGKVAYTRLRVTDMADGNLKCRVSWANPKGIPDGCGDFAHDIAIYLVQIADAVANEYAHNGSTVRVIVTDHDDCIGLCKEAREDHARRIALEDARQSNAKRYSCPHYRNGYCCADAEGNPPDGKCRHFCKGACIVI